MNWTPDNFLELDHGLVGLRKTFDGESWVGTLVFCGKCYRHELKAKSLEAAKLEALELARADLLEARDAIDSGLRDLSEEDGS